MAVKKPELKDETRKPDFVVRAKQSPDSQYWMNVGVAWSFKDGKEGFSVKLHSIPTNWDGDLILLPPLPDKE